MNSSDIISILQWWFVILVLGIGFLPLTFSLFKNFFDKGYIFSKILALSITSYLVLLVGVLHVLPFTQTAAWFLFFLLVTGIFIIAQKKNVLAALLKPNLPLFVFEELLFLAGLFLWAYIRSYNPDIHGLEKFMDFGFVNSILRSAYFPPKDMWLTPFSINYYYFGHLATAVLTKLSGIPSNITFNLMIATLFSFCLVQSFSLGANLYQFMQQNGKISWLKRSLAGLLTALLVTLSGNLHTLYAFFKPYTTDKPVPFWELAFSPSAFPNAYWYPNATRFIYNTIHEFPIYSWVVADLHGHVLDIPFVLLTIAVLFSLFVAKPGSKYRKPEANHTKKHARYTIFTRADLDIPRLLLVGFLLAVMYMTNAWDGGIYLLLSGLVLFSLHIRQLRHFFLSISIVGLGLFLFSFPYNYFFKPFASGIGILCSPEFLLKIGKLGPFLFERNHCQHSPWWQLLMLYGFFYFFVISFIAFTYKLKKLRPSDVFVFLLILLSTFLIILPEFIYLKDIYPAHFRANTMFKLVFQSFIMLSVCCSYIIIRIISGANFHALSLIRKMLLVIYILLAIPLIGLVLTYPRLATNSYYGIDEKEKNPSGLDGTKYLQTLYPDDFEAIAWLNKYVAGQPVVLEAQGDSYTDFARVSANTGLPTVLGWTVHEWLWRGSYDVPSPRIAEITTMYETTDANTARRLFEKYQVQYVFVGTLEHQKYPGLSEEKLQQLGILVYRNTNTKIYKISF